MKNVTKCPYCRNEAYPTGVSGLKTEVNFVCGLHRHSFSKKYILLEDIEDWMEKYEEIKAKNKELSAYS